MDLNYLKDKLKKTVKNSKTTKFVEDHKRDVITTGIIAGLSVFAGLYIKRIWTQKLLGELSLRSISYNTAAVKISGEENAAKIYETAKVIDQTMHKQLAGMSYKDVNKLIDNMGTKLPNV